MRRLLLLDHAEVLGGAEIAQLTLAEELQRQGYEIVAALHPASPATVHFAQLGAEIFKLRLPPIRHSVPRLGAGVRALAAVVREARPDLIHSNLVRTHIYSAFLGARDRRKLVWVLHDADLPRWLYAFLGRLAAQRVTVSRWMARWYGAWGPEAQPIWCGLSPGERSGLLRAGQARRGNGVVFGAAGRMVRWKGHQLFVRALARVRSEIPEVRGLVAGAPSEAEEGVGPLAGGRSYLGELQRLSTELDLDGALGFVGHISPMRDFYRRVDVFVQTSLRPEAFSRVVMEAMMAGLPVIAASAGGPAELVATGETGLHYPSGQVDALAKAMLLLARDPRLRDRLGSAARVFAQDSFSAEREAEEYVRLHDLVLG